MAEVPSLDVRVDFYGYRVALGVMSVAGALQIPLRWAWPVASRLCWARLKIGNHVQWIMLAKLVTLEET